MDTIDSARAFPTFTPAEIDSIRKYGESVDFADGQIIFRAGQADIDLFIVEKGAIEIQNPTNDDAIIVTHNCGEFAGDFDLLTRRPVIVTAIARGPSTFLRIPGPKLRVLLNILPSLSERLLVAFQTRRRLLEATGVLGVKVIGSATCRDTNIAREFLHKNFVPHVWLNTQIPAGQAAFAKVGSPTKTPAIVCTDGRVLLNPKLPELAKCVGVWRECVDQTVDFAIVGAGPAGIAAAVYAASEGLSTLVLDRSGPGGQAGGSSRIENFIGFPSGLSGTELATRGVLQMLKFGARLVAPVSVERLEASANHEEPHRLHLDCGATVTAKVVLIATGLAWRMLSAKGIERFKQAGVYHACTSVEADSHEGHDVAVVGAGNSAGQAAMFLAERCARCVHVIIRRELGVGMSEYLAGRLRATPNVKIHNFSEVTEVFGDFKLRQIEIKTDNQPDKKLDVAALFVFIGADPQVSWVPKEILRDQNGYLLTGIDAERSGSWPLSHRFPCPLETTIPGILAAGDVRAGSTKRVGFAVGDGSLSVTCAHKLLSYIANPSPAPIAAAR